MLATDEVPEVLPFWKDVLREQGRSIAWLARQTGKASSTVHFYASGRLKTPEGWLNHASLLLGVKVGGKPRE